MLQVPCYQEDVHVLAQNFVFFHVMPLFSSNTFNYNINFHFLFFTFCLFMLFCCQLITDISAPELYLKFTLLSL